MKRIFFVLFAAAIPLTASSQIYEVGVFAGGSNYIGEVGPTDYIAPNEPALGLIAKWNRSPRHSWRASFTYGKLASNDADSEVSGRKERGYAITNSVKELSAGLEFNFFEFNLHESDFQITPYLYGGLSYFWYTESYIRNQRQYKGSTEAALAVPMTMGVKANILENFILGFEVGARYTFTDNLDGSYAKDDSNAAYRFGNLESRDWYVFTGLTLTYTFGNKPCYCSN